MSKNYLKYATFADNVTQDKYGKPIVFSVFDNINMPQNGVVHSFGVFARVFLYDTPRKVTAKLIGPDFEESSEIFPGSSLDKPKEVNLLFNFNLINFKKVGRYYLKIFLDDEIELESKYEYYFEVNSK